MKKSIDLIKYFLIGSITLILLTLGLCLFAIFLNIMSPAMLIITSFIGLSLIIGRIVYEIFN